MRIRHSIRRGLWLLPLSLLPSLSTPGLAANDASASSECTAPNDWFSSRFPHTPFPDGNQFPDVSKVSNCDFHQWAYQMFLWLSRPASDAQGAPLNFQTLASPKALFPKDGHSPKDKAYPGRGEDEQPDIHVRVAKSQNTADHVDIFQAGPGAGVLVDQGGNVVYYTGLLNREFWDFVKEKRLYDLSALTSVSPMLDFPVNSLELKLSWRIAAILGDDGQPQQVFIPSASDYFHTEEQTVPVVKVVDGKITDNTKQKQEMRVQLALIGMHVVGVVKDHPEFIWATFEHQANAPDCSAVPSGGASPVGDLAWSLYTPESPLAVQNQFDVNNPLTAVSVCRQVPFGGGDPQNIDNIKSLNASVASQLGDSVWANYQLVGAQWTTGSGAIPGPNGFLPLDAEAQSQFRGSHNLANTTMETFTQDANCFACHNAGVHTVTVDDSGQIVPAKHLNLSHFIVNYQAWLQAQQNEQ
ncbi:hypothetical protein QLQ85_16775 [Halomonas sp. M4R5S39]|uniref:hypothetical protein n=1 Tax=Halomonas kalidii TaxID=3043293 RepID=UPI0024A9C35E|nr:hypothetical protein [Halomonas kalidii]MDI5986448.1 hypothetical protein [Halomonas kalidii]